MARQRTYHFRHREGPSLDQLDNFPLVPAERHSARDPSCQHGGTPRAEQPLVIPAASRSTKREENQRVKQLQLLQQTGMDCPTNYVSVDCALCDDGGWGCAFESGYGCDDGAIVMASSSVLAATILLDVVTWNETGEGSENASEKWSESVNGDGELDCDCHSENASAMPSDSWLLHPCHQQFYFYSTNFFEELLQLGSAATGIGSVDPKGLGVASVGSGTSAAEPLNVSAKMRARLRR